MCLGNVNYEVNIVKTWGRDHSNYNNTTVLAFMSYELILSRNAKSLTIYDATNFLVGSMTIVSHKFNAIKNGLCGGSSKYILIGNPQQLMSKLCFCLIYLAAISFQYWIFFSLSCQIIL